MGENSAIQWCDHTWNPWKGCRHVSAGCAHCYMFSDMRRYGQDPVVVRRTKTWNQPRRWNRQAAADGVRRRVFTCSWSDFFIEEADPWRDEAWDVIGRCPHLDFQVLTKRPERMKGRLPVAVDMIATRADGLPFPNVWLGVSVENRKQGLPRIDILGDTPAAIRFLSAEPLLEDLGELDLTGIHWVIIGGESGAGARPMDLGWVRSIRDQCHALGVACFVKQLGSAWAAEHARSDRKGGDMHLWPEDLRIREMPDDHALFDE